MSTAVLEAVQRLTPAEWRALARRLPYQHGLARRDPGLAAVDRVAEALEREGGG